MAETPLSPDSAEEARPGRALPTAPLARWVGAAHGIGVWSLDPATRRFWVDAEGARLLGGREPERLDDLLDLFRPEDRDEFCRLIGRGSGGVEVQPLGSPDGGPGGEAIPLFMTLSAGKSPTGGLLGTISRSLDNRFVFEALKEAVEKVSPLHGEAFFASLVRNLSQAAGVRFGMLGWIEGEDTLYVSHFAKDGAIVGEFRLPIAGTPCGDVIGDRHASASPKVIARGLGSRFNCMAVTAALGVESYVGTPIRGRSGDVIGVLALMHDRPLLRGNDCLPLLLAYSSRAGVERERLLDDRARAELFEVKSHSERLESIGLLAGGVAHDFNNLLTVITLQGEIIREAQVTSNVCGNPGDACRQSVQDILTAAERARDLTRQLLAFGRKQARNPVLLRVNDVVRDTSRMLERLMGPTVLVETVLHPEPPLVYMDPGQLTQIIVNLGVNGRDAMPEGGVLKIETAHLEVLGEDPGPSDPAPGRYVVLAVKDTGIGMPPELLERIWEPFFTTKDLGKGTGLGLSMVHGIVAQNGGVIRVSSELGLGSEFRVLLPVADPALLASDSEAREVPAAGEGDSQPCGARIMVVDDAPDMVEPVREFLEMWGHRVVAFNDPGQALYYAETTGDQLDLLLTDYTMPGINGVDLSKAVRAHHPEAKVLILTGDPMAAHDPNAEDPTLAWLGKPYRSRELRSAVERALRGERA